MRYSEEVLKILLSNDIVSGQYLADMFSISRTYIWNIIKYLRSKGYDIESRKIGYKINDNCDIVNADIINEYLDCDYNINVYDSLSSTNKKIIEHFETDRKFNTVVIAREQNAGEGRYGRSFISHKDKGIYMSIILEPLYSAKDSMKITNIAGICVAEAIAEMTGIDCKLKWVNDIYIDNKKVGGIITKAQLDLETNNINYLILGIGINVNNMNTLKNSLGEIATTIFENDSYKNFKSKLIALILNKLAIYYKDINNIDFVLKYNVLLYKKDEVINFERNGKKVYNAKIIDVDKEYKLRITYDGEVFEYADGEISILK